MPGLRVHGTWNDVYIVANEERVEAWSGVTAPRTVPARHFQCYEIHRPRPLAGTVSLADVFGSRTLRLGRGKRICLPADKNGENPDAPANGGHLEAYSIKQTTPFEPIRDQVVVNQFGTSVIDLIRPDYLLVPTAKSETPPPPPFTEPLDHFKCYKVRGRFRASDVRVVDQFGAIRVDLKGPVRLCAPADKNGESPTASLSPDHLMCYRTRIRSGTPAADPPDAVITANQFGPDRFPVIGPRELCVQSIRY
jgi:hypothetical protein